VRADLERKNEKRRLRETRYLRRREAIALMIEKTAH
jgi:hypothetical protein